MTQASEKKDRVLALSGGVGGAKLALGLRNVVPPGKLTIVANTGDDFEHLGLHVSPDIDTLLYTLAGLDNPATGWGRRDETWTFMAALAGLGGETWFRLGDADLAIHVERTRRLRAGELLSDIIADFAERLGVRAGIVPMSDDPVRTRVRTASGWLDFQRYFVEQQCRPEVAEFAYDGAATAKPHAAFVASIGDPELRAVVICPSNPFISIEPILALPGVREALRACAAPVVAVAPIIGDQRGQRSDGEDDAGTRSRDQRRNRGRALRRLSRRLRGRRLRRGADRQAPGPRHRHQGADGFTCGSRTSGDNDAQLG